MRRTLVVVASASVLALALPAGAQQQSGRVLDIKATVLDVIARTESTAEATAESPANVTIQLAGDVLFDFNKADLTPAAQATLADVAKDIDAKAKGQVMIDGYTDSVGDANYNQTLSEQRAAAVQQALQPLVHKAGVTFAAAGHGAANPVAPNAKPDGSDNPDGRAKNRRVTVSFAK